MSSTGKRTKRRARRWRSCANTCAARSATPGRPSPVCSRRTGTTVLFVLSCSDTDHHLHLNRGGTSFPGGGQKCCPFLLRDNISRETQEDGFPRKVVALIRGNVAMRQVLYSRTQHSEIVPWCLVSIVTVKLHFETVLSTVECFMFVV